LFDVLIGCRQHEQREPTGERTRILEIFSKVRFSAGSGGGLAVDDMTATRDLLEQHRAGDADALNQLYTRYSQKVLKIVRARLGAELRQRVQSLDIVQEAMLDSLKNLEKFDYASEGAFLKWLTAIVENRIRDQHDYHTAARRNLGKESPLENPGLDGSAIPIDPPDSSGAPTASRAMMLTEDLLRLEQALNHLPAETRELIIAVKLEGRTYQELADETGKTSDAVRMQVHRAMDALTAVFRDLEAKGTPT
jgi:RNA polymerase sigma-70 factor (ECF subfamily)